jgi:DNA-directed RNA polymerase beta' subunit
LKKISAEDCNFIGFSNAYSRPEWMILTAFPISPPAMRPSVRQDNNQRSEDDLTYSLVSIIKFNKLLKQKMDSDCAKNIIDSYHGLLQYYVATYMDNEIPGIPQCAQRSGRCLKAITQRQKGKEGRLRGNIMGKRVDFSARTVISVGTTISIDEFGVPLQIAMNLTYPETVTKYNINDMYKLVRNGPTKYPGAKSVKKVKYDCNGNPSPCTLTLKYVDLNSVVLHEGDIVNRHLQNGDICIFNRQPSLHRMSMMGMKVKILPGKTFKLNVSVCLSGDTKINTEYGSCLLENVNKDLHKIKSINWNDDKEIYDCNVEKYFEVDPKVMNFKCYEIKTETGQIIKCTEEHPFMVKGNDRILAKNLKVDDYLVSFNQILPKIDLESGMDILDENNIKLPSDQKTSRKHLMKILGQNGLLNIKKGSLKQIILAGLLGHLIGDGTLWWNTKNVHLTFRRKDECDIYEIKRELLKLGIDEKIIKIHKHGKSKTNTITNRNGKVLTIEGNENRGLYEIDIRSKPIAVAFWNIGMPVMDRVKQEFNVPDWIMNGPKMVKRQFLAGYFGTDMSKPFLDKRTQKRFDRPKFKMSKIDGLTPYKFFDDLYQLLHEFNIETNYYGTEKGNIRKDGNLTTSYNGSISSEKENLINFYEKIGYAYSKEKNILSNYASQYLRYSKNNDVITYYEWCKDRKIDNSSACWNKIVSIREINIEKVYDITTADDNHNFLGNGIFSYNCSPFNADHLNILTGNFQ